MSHEDQLKTARIALDQRMAAIAQQAKASTAAVRAKATSQAKEVDPAVWSQHESASAALLAARDAQVFQLTRVISGAEVEVTLKRHDDERVALSLLYDMAQAEAEQRGYAFAAGPWGQTLEEAQAYWHAKADERENLKEMGSMPETSTKNVFATQATRAETQLAAITKSIFG